MLKKNDIIELKNGMCVYANIPEKFVLDNRRFSDKSTRHKVEIGKCLNNESFYKIVFEELIHRIRREFASQGISVTSADLQKVITEVFKPAPYEEFTVAPGIFGVTYAQMEPGGEFQCHQEPPGYHVACERLGPNNEFATNGEAVNFYQGGWYTCMLPNIKPIGRLKEK